VLYRVAGSGSLQGGADALGAVPVEVAAPDQGAQLLFLCRIGALHGERDQHGVLRLAQVVHNRLSRVVRVAEDPEQVIAQLEGLADRQTATGQGAEDADFGAGECDAEIQRASNAVLHALVFNDPQGGIEVVGRLPGVGQVEI
jgi:hypothetical protein